MMKIMNISSILFLAVILSANIHPSRCSSVSNCQNEPCDPCYEEDRQELADEIDDVNDYMQMVADQLTNDGVIVVRAVKTRFTDPDMGDSTESDSLALEAGDFDCDNLEETESPEITSSPKTELQLVLEHENDSSNDLNFSEMKQTDFEIEQL